MSDQTSVDAMKEVTKKAEEFLGALELVNLEVSSQDLQELINNPIGLRDTGRFNVSVKMPTLGELQDARRELGGAIAAEKWADGFMMALSVLTMFG